MPNLKTDKGRPMRCDEIYERFGLRWSAHLPDTALPPIDIDGTQVYVLGPQGGKHRVMAVCSCGKHVPAGRLSQHRSGSRCGTKGQSYVSTYCNFAHRVADGKPIQHECRIIPPRALRLEMKGNITKAIEILQKAPVRMMRRGVAKA